MAAIRTRISATNVLGGFAYAFDGRVYLDRAPANALLPLCVYRPTTERSDRMVQGYELVISLLFQMYDSADSTSDLQTAQERLKTALDGYTASLSGHDRITCRMRRQGQPVQDDDAWLVEDEYEVRATLL